MNIGGYEISPINWGSFRLDGGAMFGVVPKVLWEKKFPADDKNRILMYSRGLLLQGHNKNILIDLGIGEKEEETFTKRYQVQDIKSHNEKLAGFNLTPDDITDVIISHLHFDHCGGSTLFQKELLPTFQNAKYYVQKKQWESALSGKARDGASFFPKNYMPLKENNNLVLIDGEKEELLKNISIKVSNGHTTAQQHPLITGEKSKLFYCADIFPTAAHIEPKWIMAYDNKPETTLKEKRNFLDKAAKENWIMFFEHDPYYSACSIGEKNGKFFISEYLDL